MLSREEVLKIARLARLELSDAEVESYRQKLSKVLDHVRDLSQLDTADKGFVRHIPADVVALRADKAIPFGNMAALVELAPASEANQFLLPAILEAE
jgi:aspartyl-tRNA(Asn)/glutamyl-tRNA(Gln) amidotransferase subunit C